MKTTLPIALFCIALVIGLGGVGLAKGGLYADRYDGDMLHLLDMVLRMTLGERPHADFMTPIGVLAIWPIAGFAQLGFGIGTAFVLAQVALALLLVPAVIRVAVSRFSGGWAYGWSALVLVLVLSLVHGSADPSVSFSMHYNRWAWALAALVLPVALLAPRRPGLWADALVLGGAMAGLVLIKMTYVVALAPAVVVVILTGGQGGLLIRAVVVTLAALGGATLWLGAGFWAGYAGDLLATARSESRAYPGLSLAQVLTGPGYLLGHVVALAAVVILRRAGQAQAGLGLLLVLPGLVYVTFQNFENDPLWFLLLGVMLPMMRPQGAEDGPPFGTPHGQLTLAAIALLSLGAPVLTNMAFSPLRHLASDPAGFARMLPRSDWHDDLFIDLPRASGVGVQRDAGLAPPVQEAPPARLPDGEALERCSLATGIIAWNDAVARDLEKAGIARGARVLVADLLSPLWMFSDRLGPVRGAAPWRYGGVPGLADATHLLVPICPVDQSTRAGIMRLATEQARDMIQQRRTAHYVLFALGDQPAMAASAR